jgi:hypothetical protein
MLVNDRLKNAAEVVNPVWVKPSMSNSQTEEFIEVSNNRLEQNDENECPPL